MSAIKHTAVAVAIGLLVTAALLAGPTRLGPAAAEAVGIQGGTTSQRAYVQEVISHCWLAPALTDQGLRAYGPVTVVLGPLAAESGNAQPGKIYINSALTGVQLGELAAHEWGHQIWYTLGPKWWQKWASMCGGGHSDDWHRDFAENFAECAKVALFPSQYLWRDYAVTDLKVTPPDELKRWLTLARYVNLCPFADLYPTAMPSSADQDELAAAGGYVAERGLLEGYPDSTFRPSQPLLRSEVALVCGRAGLSVPHAWLNDSSVATRGDVRDAIPLQWTTAHWDQPLTRGQLARLLWRSR